jgi:UDP-N-acetylglucosamine--N-acetylmuramyl-(pentapeptide) pyrophosphoryl-undecaprenol N-acetylglucosamine transferase
MSTSELAAAGVPAILVPLPSSAEDHQRTNAAALASAGAALVFEEDAPGRGELWSAVLELLGPGTGLNSMSDAMRARGRPDAADRIAADVVALARVRHDDD